MIAIAVGGLGFGFAVCFVFHVIVSTYWHISHTVLES